MHTLIVLDGQSFDESVLQQEGSFKAAYVRHTSVEQVSTKDLKRECKKSESNSVGLQHLFKRKGVLEWLK